MGLVSEIRNRNRTLVRQVLNAIRVTNEVIDNDNVDNALDYLSRYNDDEQVMDAIADRWSTGLRVTGDGTKGGYEEYSKVADKTVLENDEWITTGLGRRIVTTIANLFTSETGYWDWVTGDETTEDVQSVIEGHRIAGGCYNEIANADFCSVAVGVGPMMIDWRGGADTGHLKYRAFSPSCIRAVFPDEVIDNGVARGVDYTDIEDASMVSIQLASGTSTGTTASDKQQYLAIFGRSDRPGYENGRHVVYESQRWDDVPDPGKGGTDWDYPIGSGNIANPLTIAGTLSDEYVPEYPLITLRGGYDVTTDKLFPVTTSFFRNCLEIDTELSRIAHCAVLAARGTNWIKDPASAGLPSSLEGDVALKIDQEIGNTGQPANNSQIAFDVIKGMSVMLSEGMNVPGYQVVSGTGSMMPEAGIALMIKTQPLIDHRNRRTKLNKSEVEKLWQIEKGLHRVYTGQPLAGPDVTQVWVSGRHALPEDETAKLTRITIALEKGLMDMPTAIMELRNLPHLRAAKAYLDEMKERNAEYADMMPKQQRTGIQARGKRQQPGQGVG
ncbi:MAG: hypothetical protein GY854_19780 [Deltaproteobacteria bacterium]|nr:hypothetical protein [Deltaproteobacteria bacterium]